MDGDESLSESGQSGMQPCSHVDFRIRKESGEGLLQLAGNCSRSGQYTQIRPQRHNFFDFGSEFSGKEGVSFIDNDPPQCTRFN